MGQTEQRDELSRATTITWAALLGQWIEFARSAVGLPDDEPGRCLRESVPDIIMLQAVWFALHQLDDLLQDQRALGLDRSEILIDQHTKALHRRWHNQPMPATLSELIEDTRRQLTIAQSS